MEIHRASDATEFLRLTDPLRAAEPVLTNVIGSVAGSVAGGRTYEQCLWWVLRDDEDVVGCAMRTAPWKLVVSPMPSPAAALLGGAVAIADADLPGVTGPPDAVDAVVAGMAAAGRPRTPRTLMDDVVYVLSELRRPAVVPGSARRATVQDVPMLVEWQRDFAIEAGLPTHDIETSVRSRLEQAGIWWWEVDGEQVAMAGHAMPVPTPAGDVTRIGPVYTAPARRRRGFGAAVTTAVVEHLLPSSAVVMLFADAANPTSNALYERLGFRATGRVIDVDLLPPLHRSDGRDRAPEGPS